MTVAVLVNIKSRHGSAAVGDRIRSILPEARVAVTSSLSEARAWVKDEISPNRPTILLSGGGDGTAIALLNELREQGIPVPTFGLLGLGTGNGWARATGGVGKRAVFRDLRALSAAGAHVPLRRFDLVETEGQVTPFAGTGWDAEILSDYKAALAVTPRLIDRVGGTRLGYLRSIVTRTIPRQFSQKRPTVRVINLGEPAIMLDAKGKPVPMPGGERGKVLYEGPLGVGGAATTEELGLGFRAFALAHLVPGRMQVRVFSASMPKTVLRVPQIWNGIHPIPDDHNFFLTRCRFEFDREVPFEIGGDLVGNRREIELKLYASPISLVDFRRVN